MSPLSTVCFSYGFFFLFASFCSLAYSFWSGGLTTHQQRRQGVPAPKRTRTQSSYLAFSRARMRRMLLRNLPFPAIREPVYASCSVVCSYMASRMEAVHCVRAWYESKWSRYLLLAAVDTLRMWSSFLPSLRVMEGIWVGVSMQLHVVIELVTMWMAASVRLMNVGMTSRSPPTWSSSLASHRDMMVPTSWTKYSRHFLSWAGRPPAYASVSQQL